MAGCPADGVYDVACQDLHQDYRYTEAGAAWTLLSAMIMFFMRAGFLMIELSFAEEVPEKRNIVLFKYLDVVASAIAFWLFGFQLSHVFEEDSVYYNTVLPIISINCKKVLPYIVWFFKFGFASNTATLMGGLLIKSKYRLRLMSGFLSSFFVSGLIHTTIARYIWGGGKDDFLSPYRFCNENITQNGSNYFGNLYVLDFAGGGTVHLVGGTASLVLTLFVSLQLFMDKRARGNNRVRPAEVEDEEHNPNRPNNFIEYMYPKNGGQDTIENAALGVFILWFGWFAFNCGTTESLQGPSKSLETYSNVAGRIAVNMITCAAGGGLTATIIAGFVQFLTDARAINCNEIANGILTSLVAITSNCPYVDNVSAFFIGAIAVFLYHIGVYTEYKLNIFDTARIIPVHLFGGMWSLISTGLFIASVPKEYVKETYEGVCYCKLRIPILSYFERLGAQLLGVVFMMSLAFVMAFIIYLIMYIIRLEYIIRKIPVIGQRIVEKLNLGKGGLLFVGENPVDAMFPPDDFEYGSLGNRNAHRMVEEPPKPATNTEPLLPERKASIKPNT